MDCIEVGSHTKLFGVVGEGISYTLSPVIHNFSFQRLGVNGVYLTFDIPRGKFTLIFPSLSEIAEGLNVTVPYKEDVIPFLSDLSKDAKKVGAVNTIYRGTGYNTDYLALRSLVEERIEGGGRAVLFGAGGAAKAAAFALAELGFKVAVINRTRKRSEELVRKLREAGYDSEVSESCDESHRVVVNSTPDPTFVPERCIRGELAVEFVYKPVETPVVKLALSRGMKVVNGLQILVRQAMESERIWFGKSLNDEEVVSHLYARQLVR